MDLTIDLVYLWVDGNDPKWIKKKNKFSGHITNSSGRYQDNEELKYSLRSIEKHMPWIHKIYIITDQQIPPFLDISHPKISIIDHKDIIPEKYLPTFNSVVIEYFVYRIPNLSEFFLMANDDTFVNQDIDSSFFFKDDLPVVRLMHKPLLKINLWIKRQINLSINSYRLSIENAYHLMEQKYGIFYPATPHHNIDAYRKSDFKNAVEQVFEVELKAIFLNRFRSNKDIQRILLSYYILAEKRGSLTYVGRKESCRIKAHKKVYQRYLTRYEPKLFCLNDSEKATDDDRKRIKPFLENLFPKKSSFEH